MTQLPVSSFVKDHESTIFGVFETEAFQNVAVLHTLNKFIVRTDLEPHPEASGDLDDPKQWHINYIKVYNVSMEALISTIKNSMYEGWYSLLWNDNNFYVIFTNGVAELPNNNGTISDLHSIDSLAKSNGLDHEYMKRYLSKAIASFPV